MRIDRTKERTITDFDHSKYDFHFDTKNYERILDKGLTEETVREISRIKNEPEWMMEKRVKALKHFQQRPMPKWGPDLSEINFDEITYYLAPKTKTEESWENVPEDVKKTYDRLGIPEAEKKFLGGLKAQYDSEVIYGKIREDLEKQGIIFLSMDQGLKEHEDIVKKYFGKVVPFTDNKFAALNTACWSGGSFLFVPKNTKVNIPLQAYFRINAESMGQFERTLIVAEEGSQVHYLESCSAPRYSSKSLHAAVVELIALPGSRIRYTTIQNWSNNIYNLVTKRAFAYENAAVEWLDCNLGSKVTQKYPSVYLLGERAKAEVLSIALAGKGQHQDAGAKAVHVASNTTSRITSKSISKDGGRTSYRGLLKVHKNAKNVKSNVQCDALLLDEKSRSDTYPNIEIDNPTATVAHEASTGKIGENQIFYLTSRGLSEEQAITLIVLGFIQPFAKQLPMEYALEMNRLIEMEMEGCVG